MSARGVELPPHARVVLPTGLTIVVLERRSLPLVTLRLVLRAGGAQEPTDRPGVSTLVARLVRRGAGDRDAAEYVEQVDFLGGLLGAQAGLDQVTFDAEFTTETLDEGLPLFLDALRCPRFDAGEFERERSRLVAEIVQSRDDADELAEEAFLHALYPDHPYGRTAVASTRAIERIDRDDVAAFHARGWAPDGGVLIVVGDVERNAFAQRLADELGGWGADLPTPPRPPEPRPSRGRRVILVDDRGSRQVQVRFGNLGVARNTPRWHALSVANTVFGGGFTSRLVDRVRVDEGLTYGIHSRFIAGRIPGPFVISTFTANENLSRLEELVGGLLEDFRRDGPTEDEVAAARAYMAGLQPRRIETPEGLAGAVAEAELHGLGYGSITDYRRDVEAVDRAAAAEAAREVLPAREDLLTILVGDADSLSESAARLGTLTVLPLDFGETVLGSKGGTGGPA